MEMGDGKKMDFLKGTRSEWVWLGQETEVINQYVDFRHVFTMDTVDELTETESLLYT